MSAVGEIISVLSEIVREIVQHYLKPAKEKLADIRLSNIKDWWKFKDKSQRRAENRKEELDEIKNHFD